MKSSTASETQQNYWGILICIGMAMPFISGLAALPSFGLVFGDFLRSINAGTGVTALITSAFFCAFSFAGLFSSGLFTRYGLRPVGMFGGVLYFLGSLAQIGVNSVTSLLLAFSLVQGIGFGLMVPTAYTTFNDYFVQHTRVMWMSFTQALIGLGTMVYPLLMQQLLDAYGFRGCLLILAAINAHAILGMLLMHPVEWHLPQKQKQSNENESKAITQQTINRSGNVMKDNSAYEPSQGHTYEWVEPYGKFLTVSAPRSRRNSRKKSSRSSSISSLGNWTGAIVVSDAVTNMERLSTRRNSFESTRRDSLATPKPFKATLSQRLIEFLDLRLLLQPVYVNIVLGTSFALYSDIAFFTLQPLYLFELAYNKHDTANIIAIGAAADLASRICLAVFAGFVQFPSRYIYLAGAFFTVISRFAFINIVDYVGMACITAAMGFLRTWLHVPLPLVFAEYLPPERFASGYGLFMFLQGNIMFAIGPIIGYLHDQTRDYILVFYCLNVFMALCAIPWLIEIFWLRVFCQNKTNT